jgi:LysM repeat protein
MKILMLVQCFVVLVLFSGCTSYRQESRQMQARDSNQRMSVSSDVAMLKERLKGISLAQEQLSQDIMDIRALASKTSAASGKLSAKLDRAVRALEERDAKLQKETIQTISAKMATIMKAQISTGGGTSGTGLEHVVESGQTLSAIAQAYGVTVSAIVKANKLPNPNSVRVGQKLFIPR